MVARDSAVGADIVHVAQTVELPATIVVAEVVQDVLHVQVVFPNLVLCFFLFALFFIALAVHLVFALAVIAGDGVERHELAAVVAAEVPAEPPD